MAKMTTEEAQKRFKDLLEANGSLICTDDGQAFYNDKNGLKCARNYCAVKKATFFEVKAAKKAAKKTTKKTDK